MKNLFLAAVLGFICCLSESYAQGSCPGGQCGVNQGGCPSGQCPANRGSCPSGQCPAQNANNQYYNTGDSYYPGYYPSYRYPARRNGQQCCVRPYYRQQEYDFTWARRNFENRDRQYCPECGQNHQNNGY